MYAGIKRTAGLIEACGNFGAYPRLLCLNQTCSFFGEGESKERVYQFRLLTTVKTQNTCFMDFSPDSGIKKTR